MVTELQIEQLGFDSWQGLGIFLLAIMSKPPLGPTQHPNQRVLGFLSPMVKQWSM
jgi:hypothetical protein